MLVAMLFGLDPSWGMLAVPFIGWLAGFGWACFGIAVAGFAKSIENFNYIVSAVLTPLFLLAGSFFPLEELPDVGAGARRPEPAALVRRARPRRGLRLLGWTDLIRVGALIVFGLAMWRVAIAAMTRKLVD